MASLMPPRDNTAPLSPTSPTAATSLSKSANPLSSKVSSVLSSSYADTEFREALTLLDDRGVLNTAETRRQLRLDLQKEVIDSNAEIVDEFAKVAEVRRFIVSSVGTWNTRVNHT